MKFRGALIPLLLLVVGLAVLLYPTVSSAWNAYHQTLAIQSYDDTCHQMQEQQREDLLKQAHAYNQKLLQERNGAILPLDLESAYDQQLSVDASGVMGYVDIPTIGVHLPIYHGTDSSSLQVGAGHLEWSSLPVGGAGTHCVISGHTGMPTAAMFTDVRKLREGDRFSLTVLEQTITYEVYHVAIVSPYDVSNLGLVEGEDLCTLLTCTPYGVNTDRLLVRGHRVYDVDDVEVPEAAAGLWPWWQILLLVVTLVVPVALVCYRRKGQAA